MEMTMTDEKARDLRTACRLAETIFQKIVDEDVPGNDGYAANAAQCWLDLHEGEGYDNEPEVLEGDIFAKLDRMSAALLDADNA